MGRGKKLAVDTLLFALSSFGSKILTLLLTPLYTAILSTEQYGIADLITVTINFIYPILTLAICDATLRFAFDANKSKNGILSTSLVFVVGSTLVLALCYPIVTIISQQFAAYWGIFVITYFFFNLHNCISNFIKGLGYTKLFALQGVVHTFTIICCNLVFLLWFQWGLTGYLYSIIIGYSVSTLLMIFGAKLYQYIYPLNINKALIKEMLKYSIPMIPTILAWAVNTYIDKYMIIYFCGLSDSGIYSVAHKIPSIITTVTMIFTQAWQLSVIENYEKDSDGRFFTQVYQAFDLILVGLVIAVIPFSKMIASILFAKEYYTAWSAAPFLLISTLFSSLAGFLAAAFRAAKKTNGLMKSVVIGAVVNIVLNLILLNLVGLVGAAIATAVSFLVVWLLRLIDTQKLVAIKIKAIPTIITYAVVFLVSFWYCFELPLFGLLYAAALIILIVVNYKELVTLFGMLKDTVAKKLKRPN